MSHTILRTLTVFVALLVLAGCGSPAPAPDQVAQTASTAASRGGTSQILITVESFAGRRVVPFGGIIAMPRLAELAASGTIFDDAVSTTTLARPALVSILTGVSPDRSGVRDNIHDALPAGLPTLAEGARNAGYETAAFVSTPFASYSSGLQRGFDLFDGPEALVVGPEQHVPPVVKAGVVAAHFKEWLAARGTDAPYFAWIHFADLNGRSVPLVSGDTQRENGAPLEFEEYDEALGAIDDAIGAIVDAVRADPGSRKAQWIVAGTHGTYLGEGGRFGEAFWLSDETLHVPVVRITDIDARPASARHDPRPTWLPDVAASLAAAMGVSLNAASDGIPLDTEAPADRSRLAWGYALDDQLGWPPPSARRDGSGFTIQSSNAGARPATPRVRVLPADTRRELEAKGLTVGSQVTESPIADADSWLHELQLVRRNLGKNRPGPANRASLALVKQAPAALASMIARSYFCATNAIPEGKALREKLLARDPERSDALHWAAHLWLADKKYDETAALLDAAIAVGPVEPEMYYDRACVRALRGDPKGALGDLDRALAVGYRNWEWIDKDPDLSAVRADPGFPALLRTHGR